MTALASHLRRSNSAGETACNSRSPALRSRLVPMPGRSGVLAVVAAVTLILPLPGCQATSGDQASPARSGAAAPSFGEQGPAQQGPYRITGTVPVDGGAFDLAVDPGTDTLYVTGLGPAVSVIDGTTRTVAATVPVEGGTGRLAVDPSTHTVYVTNDVDTVSVIDGPARTVIGTVNVGSGPADLAADPTTHTVYVTTGRMCANRGFCYGDGGVTVIDGATRTVTGTVSVDGETRAVAVDPGTHTVYVTTSDGVAVIDGATRTVTATVPVGGWPDNLAVDTDTHTVYVTTGDGVAVIDGARRTVTATMTLGKNPQPNIAAGRPYQLAVDPGRHILFVTYDANDTVSVIDAPTRTVTADVTLPGNEASIHKLAVDPGTHSVYVGDGTVSVIERDS